MIRFGLLLFLLLFLGKITAAPIIGKVVGVSDGDTVTLLTAEKQQIKIRLEGIDAPENGQEYGTQSKQALSDLVFGKEVLAGTTGTDRYGRTLAWIRVDGMDVSRRMVATGWAWQYLKYNKDLDIMALQDQAKQQKLGLWAAPNPPMPPWEYRALGRPAPTESSTPSEDPQGKGAYWINSNGVRHNPRCRWFGTTKSGHYSNTEEGRACGICGG